jgi:hypothetical protein
MLRLNRRLSAALLVGGSFAAVGCGNNGSGGTNVSGVWKITLSEAQSSAVGGSAPDGNTQIDIRLNQLASGNSVLSSSGGVYGDDIGCNAGRSG